MRPQYHYAAAANWLSDPNGLVHFNDEWHLFYQYNPQGEDWGNMSWGHAVSRDLANWEELPVALAGDELGMIFSGSAVIDHADSAGFGASTMVAIYTSASHELQLQRQSLAWSKDAGRSWHKYVGNPVLDLGLADFRDPNVFWHPETAHWIMVVVLSDQNRAVIYRSPDLKVWDEVSDVAGSEAPGEIWECPLLIELPIEGEDSSRWLFKVDVLRGAPGSGALYRTGTFDGLRFVSDPQGWLALDGGTDFYAAIAWHEPRDAQGRPLWLGWLGNHAYQGQLPQQGWRGAMSVPRRLSLRRFEEQLCLRQEPAETAVAEVKRAHQEQGLLGPAARLALPGDSNFTLQIEDQASRVLSIERRDDKLTVTRHDPEAAYFDTVQQVPLLTTALIDLWFDIGSLELLADDGCTAMSFQHRMRGDQFKLSYASTGLSRD